jgi:hypothetical protein
VLQPGQVVGSYEVVCHAGSGGMAEVYRVRHVALGSEHALKVLKQELAGSEDLRSRFLAEGRVQAQVRHPHIAMVTDLVAEEGVAALVMEWLDGGSLEDRLVGRSGRAVPTSRALQVLLPVLDALQMLHDRGIVHRDLKAGNLVFRDDRWDRVVLTDFGIARIAEDALAGAGRHRTRTGMQIGTPHYMSPEQVRGEEVDARSDLFSMGVVAWELLTAELPFDGPSAFEVMQRIVDEERPSLGAVRPDLPDHLVAAIDRALALHAEGRFASATELADALRGADLLVSFQPPTSVPEPDAMFVEELEPAPVDEPPAPRGGCLWPVMIVLLCGLMLGGAALAWSMSQQQQTEVATAQVWEMLRVYKTDAAANGQPARLEDALLIAQGAALRWPSPEALGSVALIRSWQQGWQLGSGRWDPVAWDAVEVLVRGAGDSLQADVAEVWLQLGACRLNPEVVARNAACWRLQRVADRVVSKVGEPWLAVEIEWIASMGARSQMERSILEGRKIPTALAEDALDRCRRGLDQVAAARVNGRFLEQNCVMIAGWSGHVDTHLRFGDAMVRRARLDGTLDRERRRALYVGANPACLSAGLQLGRDGRPTSWSRQDTGGVGDLCVFLGQVAEGCAVQARLDRPKRCPGIVAMLQGASCEPLQEPGVPWDEAEAARAATAGDRTALCLR